MLPRFGKIILGLGLGLTFLAAACASVPYTGRHQLLLVSEGGEIATASRAFEELKRRYPVCQDPEVINLVNRVGSRIAAAVNRPDYHWEFVALENPQEANAFCLPGGKVGIFTGILGYTQDEAGLATVISHEAAHVLARHAEERQSQEMLVHWGSLGLSLGLGGVNPLAGQAITQGYGLGTQYGILLPYSRTQELEADKIGLILMAKAGYDPALALDFWRRMLADRENQAQPPQFLSPHPRDEKRLQAMAKFLPRAEDFYLPAASPPAGPPEVLAPPPEVLAPPPEPAWPPEPPPAPAPPGGPPLKSAPAPDSGKDSDDLKLKTMDNRNQTAPPCGQWGP
jgi:predicted Zn-dependent protease